MPERTPGLFSGEVFRDSLNLTKETLLIPHTAARRIREIGGNVEKIVGSCVEGVLIAAPLVTAVAIAIETGNPMAGIATGGFIWGMEILAISLIEAANNSESRL